MARHYNMCDPSDFYCTKCGNKNMLTVNQANYLITFTHFANPLFVITVTQKIFNNILLFIDRNSYSAEYLK